MNDLPSELDFRIMLELDDEYLLNMCSTDIHYHSICQDEGFWKEKAKRRFFPFLHLRKHFSSWKIFYKNLSYHAAYVIIHASDVFITSNIEIAYEWALKYITSHIREYSDEDIDPISLENLSEISKWGDFMIYPVQIYIMLDSIEIFMNDPNFLIFNLGPPSGVEDEGPPLFYIHPEFFSLPSLSTRGSFLWYIAIPIDLRKWVGNPKTKISLGRPSQKMMKKIFFYGKKGLLFNNQFEMVVVEDNSGMDIFSYIRDEKIFFRDGLPLLIVREDYDDFLFTIIPEVFYENLIETRKLFDELYRTDREFSFISLNKFLKVYRKLYETILWFPITEKTIFPDKQMQVFSIE